MHKYMYGHAHVQALTCIQVDPQLSKSKSKWRTHWLFSLVTICALCVLACHVNVENITFYDDHFVM